MRVTRIAYAVDGWGVGELWLGDGRIVLAHEAPSPQSSSAVSRSASPTSPSNPHRGATRPPSGTYPANSAHEGDGFVSDLVRRIHSFFAGEPVSFADVELDLEWCTPFQHAVASQLRAVPWGEVVSYGELADRAGYPRAGRAAGSFCAHNKFFLLVPCHRVVAVRRDRLVRRRRVGFKRRLLRLERHASL